jgi:sulfur carrier protein
MGDDKPLIINGQPRSYETGLGIRALITELLPGPIDSADPEPPAGIAVAVNGIVVPRGQWTRTELRAGDRIEIVRAVQGG